MLAAQWRTQKAVVAVVYSVNEVVDYVQLRYCDRIIDLSYK
jgi:hypothetical protein